MSDLFFKPKTIKDCHKRIEGLLHTNKTQADELGKIKEELSILKQKYDEALKANKTFARNEAMKRRSSTIIDTLADRISEVGLAIGDEKLNEIDKKKGILWKSILNLSEIYF